MRNRIFRELENFYVCRTAVRVNTTDTRLDSLDLFVASGITTHIDCRPGISNSNCSEGQIRTYRATRGPHCGAYATMAVPKL